MDRKQSDHRPDERPAEHGAGRPRDPMRQQPERKAPEALRMDKGRQHPEGPPTDKPVTSPETGLGGKDILETDRSDRESGRPLELEKDERQKPGRADAEPGRGDRPQEGRPNRRAPENQPTKR